MYGGTICGNYFTNGGAGMTIESGTVNMYGGEIRGNCVSVSAGAGVRIEEFGNFNMAGDAVIRENVSISTTDYGSKYGGGGGVYVYGKFTMSEHARIEDNRADRGATPGGGVLVNSKGVFKMIGGDNYTVSIDNNYARDNGGGVYAGGTFEISGAVAELDQRQWRDEQYLSARRQDAYHHRQPPELSKPRSDAGDDAHGKKSGCLCQGGQKCHAVRPRRGCFLCRRTLQRRRLQRAARRQYAVSVLRHAAQTPCLRQELRRYHA